MQRAKDILEIAVLLGELVLVGYLIRAAMGLAEVFMWTGAAN